MGALEALMCVNEVDGPWNSSTLHPEDTFTFTEPGTDTDLWTIRPSMTATVTLKG
jgi:hypothetical protein